MTAAVADTSPINYLILIGEIEVLPALFSEVIVPSAVLAELRHPKAPPLVAQWIETLPGWTKVMAAVVMDPDIRLGAGETAAISLAVEMGLPAVLMDERKGRSAAEARGLIAVGTLNILDAADEAGLVDFAESMRKLVRTNFRMEAALVEAFMDRVRMRKGTV